MTAAERRLLSADARALPLAHEAVAPADVRDGAPTTASAELMSSGGASVGVWEITPGTVVDVEADEVFVVLAGRGEVELDDGSRLPLSAGTAVRLRAGDRTTWTITETLRKVYVLLPSGD
jgi:uncharacterized cupin superfamily protein